MLGISVELILISSAAPQVRPMIHMLHSSLYAFFSHSFLEAFGTGVCMVLW